jgi:hypothetical protein
MALYIPPARRRRRLIAATVLALAAGLAAGVLIGRASSPSTVERVRTVQADARAAAAGLRVLALHDEAGAIANDQAGDGGADLALSNTRTALQDAFAAAPWLGTATRTRLLHDLDQLAAITDRTSKAFGTAAEALATEIDTTFNPP